LRWDRSAVLRSSGRSRRYPSWPTVIGTMDSQIARSDLDLGEQGAMDRLAVRCPVGVLVDVSGTPIQIALTARPPAATPSRSRSCTRQAGSDCSKKREEAWENPDNRKPLGCRCAIHGVRHGPSPPHKYPTRRSKWRSTRSGQVGGQFTTVAQTSAVTRARVQEVPEATNTAQPAQRGGQL